MSMISHQINELKVLEDWLRTTGQPKDANTVSGAIDTIEALSAKVREQNLTHDLRTETHGVCSEQATDLIRRQDAIDAVAMNIPFITFTEDCKRTAQRIIGTVPSADRPKREWTTEQVAEMLANLFGDECACNYNGNDEWLPSACKYADTQCPDPKEKHGCWMQFLIQGGGTSE